MCRECLYPFCLTRTPWRRYCHGVHFVDSKRECREGNCPRPFQSRQQGLLYYDTLFATQALGAGDRRLAETEKNVTLIGKTDA